MDLACSHADRAPETAIDITAFHILIEAQADTDEFELVGGFIVVKTNPAETHEQIDSNIGAPLKLAMFGDNCRIHQDEISVQDTGDKRDSGEMLIGPCALTRH